VVNGHAKCPWCDTNINVGKAGIDSSKIIAVRKSKEKKASG
jgi:hypothetical protein